MFVSGAAILGSYNHLPPLSAILASVSTITTIGLYVPNQGNFQTMPSLEAALLIVMIIVSVGAGASIVQSTVGTVAKGALAKGGDGEASYHSTKRSCHRFRLQSSWSLRSGQAQ
jgi:hypothetical protein